jgi:hypothetical protein
MVARIKILEPPVFQCACVEKFQQILEKNVHSLSQQDDRITISKSSRKEIKNEEHIFPPQNLTKIWFVWAWLLRSIPDFVCINLYFKNFSGNNLYHIKILEF